MGDRGITTNDAVPGPLTVERTTVGVGDAFIAFDHTIVAPTGPDAGDGATIYGAGVSDVDPRFVNPAAADHRLQPGSPAIDTPDAAIAPAGQPLDLAGAPRRVDGDGGGVTRSDLGGRVRLTLSERARVTLTSTAVDRKARPRTVRRSFTAAKGRNAPKIRARALKGAPLPAERRRRRRRRRRRSRTLTRTLTVRR